MKIRPLGAELLHADGRTDGRTDRQTDMTNVIVIYRNFAKAPRECNRSCCTNAAVTRQ